MTVGLWSVKLARAYYASSTASTTAYLSREMQAVPGETRPCASRSANLWHSGSQSVPRAVTFGVEPAAHAQLVVYQQVVTTLHRGCAGSLCCIPAFWQACSFSWNRFGSARASRAHHRTCFSITFSMACHLAPSMMQVSGGLVSGDHLVEEVFLLRS